MTRLGWVLAGGLLVACSHDLAQEDRPPDALVAETLAAREAPPIKLPDRPVTRLGRCAVELGPRPAQTHDLLVAAFVARNGAAWDTDRASFDPSSGVLQSILSTDIASSGDVRGDSEVMASAIDFLVTNYDLFGMTRGDLARVTPQLDRPVGDENVRTVRLSGDHAFDGPAEDPPAVWAMSVSVDRAGNVALAAMTSNDLLPLLGLCDQPGLKAGDARVVQSVIGYHLVFGGVGGMPVDVGNVVAADVRPAKLITFRAPVGPNVSVRVAYEVPVMRDSLPWSFIVDAETGELLAVIQQFFT